jgi:hypothetical protein
MQNRPNRCAFAMTDFSATNGPGHFAEALMSYSCMRAIFPQRSVPRGTLLEAFAGGTTWAIAEIPPEVFHVEHSLRERS